MVFEIFTTVIFFLAVSHIFFSNYSLKLAHSLTLAHGKNSGAAAIYTFLGNPAVIFGLWLIPILIVMAVKEGGANTYEFLAVFDLLEPFAYFVLIAIATVRPLQKLFNALLFKVGKLFKRRLYFYWLGVILMSSLLSGVFSEIAIMTLVCSLLSTSFFKLRPSSKLTYFTFTLLLLAISMGTTILPLNFSFFHKLLNGSWDRTETFRLFGWRVFVALLCVCLGVGSLFKREFATLQKKFVISPKETTISFREVFYVALFILACFGKGNAYILLMVLATIIILHKPFHRIKGEEGKLQLYFPIIVAFFTYSLEIHTSLQKWWVVPLFEKTTGIVSYGYAFFLTGLNEHIPLEGLKSTFQGLSADTQFLSFLGVLAGGGLTIIAKSANIIAKLKLRGHFPQGAISPLLHLLLAIPLGLLLSAIVAFLHYIGGAP